MTATPEAVVRRLVELMPAGRAEEVGNLLDPDVVWLGSRGGLDANRVVRGIDAYLEYMEEIEGTWEQFDAELERLMVADDTVVAFLRETGRSRDGLELHNETAAVFKVRDGKIIEMRGYLDRDEALQAAGLQK